MIKSFTNTNYWAIVLGGSRGLGLATVKKLAQHGMNICLIHRTRKGDLPELEVEFGRIESEGVLLKHFNIDATNSEKRQSVLADLQAELSETGKVRVLVHSIAKGNLKPMIGSNQPELQHDDFGLTLDAMAISLYDWAKAVQTAGLFASDARIISFTSEGSHKPWRNYAAVSVAKAALEAMTRSIALELAPLGIRANCIMAGVTDTESMRMIPGSDDLLTITQQRSPFNRLTTPDDVANVVYLLCTDEAAWINGVVIPVNGGEHLQ